jgi:dihydroneopterin aldolase
MDENSYKTIEALAEFIAKSCLKELNILRIIINLKKLKALVFAQYSAVQITRNLSDYEN